MPVVLTVMLLLVAAGERLDDAFSTLVSSTASSADKQRDFERIGASSPDDEAAWVARLVGVWSHDVATYSDWKYKALHLACTKSGDESADVIVNSVTSLLGGDLHSRDHARQFFSQAIEVLSRRVTDPEPLLTLAADAGCLRSICRMDVPDDLREQFLIEALKVEKPLCARSRNSIACFVSPHSIASLRQMMRNTRKRSSRSTGFDIALRTLVQLEDHEIVGDLRSMKTDSSLSKKQRHVAATYLSKLLYQDSTEHLLSVVRKERDNKPLLRWAVRRLLWLGAGNDIVRQGLATNRRIARDERNIAKEMSGYLFPESGQLVYSASWDGRWLMLDREELRTACEASRSEPLDFFSLMQYTTAALVRRGASAP